MFARYFVFLSIVFSVSVSHAQVKSVAAGMKLTKTTKFRNAVYKLSAPSDISKSLLVIEGDNIIVDFSNATLQGNITTDRPDEFNGLAILVRNCKNVTVRNLKIRGYRIALMARNVISLTLENCDFSYNYRPQLNSTQEKEDISDWMSYHQNEKDEWLRYGAAIYLRECNSAVIRNCIVTGGQNALMMTRCDNGNIYNNDFSFNSGIGIGMYRCSSNQVVFNRINFNVRGYSDGIYNRGQDSAGILVYEQSNHNLFYKNSVTHGGDGFFLWAGQTTMDSGQGGCNDNLIRENDFSYAPTNGIEVTFSRNKIIGNRIFECDHGIWGGYSYSTWITNNQFRDNRIAIAIEHGQHNKIFNNIFFKDKEAIRLWSRKLQPSDWGYAKYRDTRSADYTIVANSFNSHNTVFNVSRTDSMNIFGNSFSNIEEVYKLDSLVTNIDSSETLIDDSVLVYNGGIKGKDPFAGNGKYRGRKNIMITEWGPYDFRSPFIWNTNPKLKYGRMQFELFGPRGKWKIKSFKGVEDISLMNGEFPATFTAKKSDSARTDVLIELEYTGPAFVSLFGNTVPAGKPYSFYFRKYFQPIDWEIGFYPIDTAMYNPITTGRLFSPTEKKAPVILEGTDRLEYAWWGGIKAGALQYPQFITLAEGTASFDPGTYELAVTWDDAVRVYIDEKLVLDEWYPSRYKFDESPHKKIRIKLGGKHHFRVEHVELGGFATLSLKIKPVD